MKRENFDMQLIQEFMQTNLRTLGIRLYKSEISIIENNFTDIIVTRKSKYKNDLWDCILIKRYSKIVLRSTNL